MKKKVHIGMIGCGSMGRSVVRRVLRQSDRVGLAAVVDPDERSIGKARQELGDFKVYSDYRQLVRDPEVDWVFIASWNNLHREHAVASFKAGKDVFCQKPLATTVADCLAMKRAFEESGRLFNIGFTLRYSPHYRKIRRLLEKGEIGRLISMEFNETLAFNHGGYIMGDWRRLQKYAGTHLLEKCCHDLDLANWMVGDLAGRVASFGGLDFFVPGNEHHIERLGKGPKGVDAYRSWPGLVRENPFTAEKDIVDNQVAIIEYAGGVRAAFHTNCNSAIPERRMVLLGSEGTIRADVISGVIELKRIGFRTRIRRIDSGGSGGHGGGDEVLARELIASMLYRRPPATGLDDGLKSAFTAFAIDKAQESGRVVDVSPYWKKAGWETGA